METTAKIIHSPEINQEYKEKVKKVIEIKIYLDNDKFLFAVLFHPSNCFKENKGWTLNVEEKCFVARKQLCSVIVLRVCFTRNISFSKWH